MNCSVCGIDEKDAPKFYYNSIYGNNLCNKHYLQLRRHGEVIDSTPNTKSDKCAVCGYKEGLKRCGLDGDFKGKTLCGKHYSQVFDKGIIFDALPTHKNILRVCEECGEDKSTDVIFCAETGQMLCRKHYNHIRTYGSILERSIHDKNTYVLKEDEIGEFAEIILRNRDHEEIARTVIDSEDIDRVLEKIWGHAPSWGYVTSGSKENFIMLQNYIMNQKGLIDHIDRNPLNNRKYNLILSNKSLNALNCGLRNNNKSGVTGVSFDKTQELWRSYINWEGKRLELGYNVNIDDAIRLRLLKENELLGILSPQKHLFEEHGIEVNA